MAIGSVVTKKVYISGSAYELKVTNKLKNGVVGADLRVVGSKTSSTVKYDISLYRDYSEISDYSRKGSLGPKKSVSYFFHNVMDKGSLEVSFRLNKTGGSGGFLWVNVKVPSRPIA